MSNNNTPSKAEALEAMDQIARHLAPYGVSARDSFATLRAFISGATDAANAGEPAAKAGWFLPDSAINEPMRDGLRNLMEFARIARWTNAVTRKDGVERMFEADWIKHMRRVSGVAADESTRAPDGWKPIKTAPQDGTRYLAVIDLNGEYEILNKPPNRYPGSWSLVDGEWRGQASGFAATQWMPLPAPPSGERPSAPAPEGEK